MRKIEPTTPTSLALVPAIGLAGGIAVCWAINGVNLDQKPHRDQLQPGPITTQELSSINTLPGDLYPHHVGATILQPPELTLSTATPTDIPPVLAKVAPTNE